MLVGLLRAIIIKKYWPRVRGSTPTRVGIRILPVLETSQLYRISTVLYCTTQNNAQSHPTSSLFYLFLFIVVVRYLGCFLCFLTTQTLDTATT
jgi:hypothetical protein